MDLHAGMMVTPRVRLVRLLGEGGMGSVWVADHLTLQTEVAVKFISARLSRGDPAVLERFRREASAAAQIKSPHVVQTFDQGVMDDGTPFIVMELLEGENLLERIQRRGPLPVAVVVSIAAQVGRALDKAHAAGIVHRDIKPENVFLSGADDELFVKVLDFGIAKRIDPSASQGMTLSGAIIGSPRYMSPERLLTDGEADARADMWALGVVVYQALLGRPPFAGDSLAALCMAICSVQYAPPSATAAHLAPLDGWFARVLVRDPAARHADLREMLATLHDACEAVDPSAAPAMPLGYLLGGASGPVTLPAARREPPTVAVAVSDDAGQSRVATLLFADVPALAALAGKIEPQLLADLTAQCLAALKAAVTKLGGVVHRELPHGLMAVFGLRRGSPDDAHRAVHAALSMGRAVEQIALPRTLRRVRLGARAGITTGRVFVGPSSAAPTVIGDPVQIAARLQEEAPPGAVLIGRDTHRQVAGWFQVERLATAPATAPGAATTQLLAAYRVIGPMPARHSLRAVFATEFHGRPARMFGRTVELGRLQEALEHVVQERTPALVSLVGSPGVGRTRILAELASRLPEGEHLVLATQCAALHRDTVYGVMASMLRGRLFVHHDDPHDVVLAKVRAGIEELREAADPVPADLVSPLGLGSFLSSDAEPSLDAEEIAEQLARLLGASSSGGGDAMTPDETTDRARNRVVAAVTSLLRLAGRSVVILCDDIQWADDASLELLDELLVRVGDLPLLIVCTAQPALYERRPLWGEGKSAHQRLDVAPLARRYLEEMTRDRLQRVEGLDAEVVRELADRAEGSPLTLDEVLHLLIDAGVIEMLDERRWRIHRERLGELALPTTIQGIIQARLDRLGEAERATLSRAAVIGRTFWDGAVAELQLGASGPAERARVGAVLAGLRQRDFVRARESSTFPDEQEYVFVEAAAQDVAYQTLSLKLRRQLHRQLAGWLDRRGGSDAGAARTAWHHEHAGDLGPAAQAYVQAAQHASELGQNNEALRNLERAAKIEQRTGGEVELGELADDTFTGWDEAEESRVIGWRERVRVQLGHGDVLRRLGRVDEADAAYARARERILRSERRDGEALARAEVLLWDARVDHRLALVKQLRGALDEAGALVVSAIERSTEGGAAEETAQMWALLAAIHSRRGELDRCREASLRGLRVCRAVRARDARWREAVSELLITLGGVFYKTGRLVVAERCYRQASRVVDARAQAAQASRALNNVAATRFVQGDVRGARDVFRTVVQLSERSGELAMAMTALGNLAEVELQLGEPELAHRYASHAVRIGEQLEAAADLPDFYRNAAEAQSALGRHEDALGAVERALALAEAPAGRVYLPAVVGSAARISAAAHAADAALGGRARALAERLLAGHADLLGDHAALCHGLIASQQ